MLRWISERPITFYDISRLMPLGVTVRGVNYEEARSICFSLGGELPSGEDFKALISQLSDDEDRLVWCWTSDSMSNFRRALWRADRREHAQVQLAENPTHKDLNIGFRCLWTRRVDVPRHIKVVRLSSTRYA